MPSAKASVNSPGHCREGEHLLQSSGCSGSKQISAGLPLAEADRHLPPVKGQSSLTKGLVWA